MTKSPAEKRWKQELVALRKETAKNRSYVKRMRKLGVSNYEIAIALGIKETDPVLQERT